MAKLYVLFGKTTSGKTSVLSYLSKIDNSIGQIIRTTSRPIREGEVQGVDYYFVEKTPREVELDHIEFNIYNEWFYGTRFIDIKQAINKFNKVIMTGSYHSVQQIISAFEKEGMLKNNNLEELELELIYLDVSEEKQIERIKNRGESHQEEGARRIEADKEDYPDFILNSIKEYDSESKSYLNGFRAHRINADLELDKVQEIVYNIVKGEQILENKNKTITEEVRLEDLGKQLLAKAPAIDPRIVLEKLKDYIEKTSNSTYLLYSKEVGFFQVFTTDKPEDFTATAIHIIDFLDNSNFAVQSTDTEYEYIKFKDNITFVEDEDEIEGLSLWFKTYYFQLIPYDIGVEKVGTIY